MFIRRERVLNFPFRIILAVFCYGTLAGCATSHDYDKFPENGSLKSAMLSSAHNNRIPPEERSHADEEQHDRVVGNRHELEGSQPISESNNVETSAVTLDYGRSDEIDTTYYEQAEHQASDHEAEEVLDNFSENLHKKTIVNTGIGFGMIPVRSHAIHQLRETTAYVELDNNTYAIAAALAAASYELNKGTLQEAVTHNTLSYGWLLYFKGYLNASQVFISPYWLVGYGNGKFRWSYDNPVSDVNGYAIYSDSVTYTDLRLGIGGEIARSYGLGVSVSATVLMRLYDTTTDEGFANDIFSSHLSPIFGTSIVLRI